MAVLFTRFYIPLTALYIGQKHNEASNFTKGIDMTLSSRMNAAALLLAATLMIPAGASAQMMDAPPDMPAPGMGHGGPGAGHGGPGPGARMDRGGPMGMRVELSEAQQDKAFALRHAAEPLHRELAKAVHNAREALHAMVKAGEFDEKKAAVLAQRAGPGRSRA
jgi:protein CpxP